ncbi:MAG TPA: gephyrin-like molybdotransferase Glp [Pyrinomonadaceae bacterium]|nr:gephyrin-like molybdotransferase Glp [Pyrinomonadaceae bacterium]
MISISEAIDIITRETVSLNTETIDLENSIGQVLAQDVFADSDLPPFDRSQMDGFAVRTKDIEKAGENNPLKLKIIGESIAGKGFDGKIKKNEAVRIMTGARVPGGADSVQKKESARETENKKGKNLVEIFEATKARQNFVLKGAEIKAGARVFETGEIITAQMIAPLASFGYGEIKVYKKPKVAVLATGSEIVDINETPQKDQIRNSNSLSLKVFAEKISDVEILPIAGDEIENLKAKIKRAIETCDVLIISGGVSVGDYDFTKPALRESGAEMFFEKVSLRPGKPTVFAKLNGKLIFGLPGNPVSVAVTFFLFVRTALLKMQEAKKCELKSGRAVLSQKIKGAKGRDSFLPAFVETNETGKLVVESLKFGGSSNFIEFARANCLMFVPRDETLEAGEVVSILFLP